MLGKRTLEHWADISHACGDDEIAAEALVLSWIHWDEIANMSLGQMAYLDNWNKPVTYTGGTCACCKVFHCNTRQSNCPLDRLGPYTAEQSQCCGGCWRMFHNAYKQWTDVGKPIKSQWLAILRTAAEDVRTFIGSVINGQ